ncbi:MAG: hypothetical protein PF487_08940 [Bacteroidales bacterium]|jgi:hypothetical protein|nr:hypothetical protein [Bacteroidales bacterium]
MPMRIYKYELNFQEFTDINLPKGSEILTVQLSQKTKKPYLWVLVDTDQTLEYEERCFELFGDDHEIHYGMGVDRVYIGTYQYQKGEFVGHVFERIL